MNEIASELIRKTEQLQQRINDPINLEIGDESIEENKKKSVRKYIDELIDFYETKAADSKDCKISIDSLRK